MTQASLQSNAAFLKDAQNTETTPPQESVVIQTSQLPLVDFKYKHKNPAYTREAF
jgi:hypothetical protein